MWNLTFSSKTNTILNYFMRINIGCSLKIDWNALFWVRRTICALVGNQVELKSKWYSFRPKLKWHGTKDNTCWRQTTTIITNEHCKFDIISLAFQCNRLIGSKIKIEGKNEKQEFTVTKQKKTHEQGTKMRKRWTNLCTKPSIDTQYKSDLSQCIFLFSSFQ